MAPVSIYYTQHAHAYAHTCVITCACARVCQAYFLVCRLCSRVNRWIYNGQPQNAYRRLFPSTLYTLMSAFPPSSGKSCCGCTHVPVVPATGNFIVWCVWALAQFDSAHFTNVQFSNSSPVRACTNRGQFECETSVRSHNARRNSNSRP